MSSLVADRVSVGRAAIASSIAARTGMRLALHPGSAVPEGNAETLLTVCSFPPAGYPMETELLPLEGIMRGVEERVGSGEVEDAGEMTLADHMLEEINAFVHDKLLNPVLPFEPITPVVSAIEPINEVYGETLLRATFAGSVAPSSPRYEQARDLLFDDDEPSQALLTYRDYEERAQDAQGEPERLQRLEAEWIGIGRKLEIEAAFRTLREEAAEAGFEDERNALKERFRAGEKKRIDAAGVSYYKAQLAPIAPLFSEESGSLWQRVEMNADDVDGCVDASMLAAFDLSLRQVNRATERLRHLSFEYIVCDLVRTWLERSFFTAEYWSLDADEKPLSDGKGGGRLPVLPTRIVFIRGAEAVYEGETTAHLGTPDDLAEAMPKTMHILQVSGDDASAKEDRKVKMMDAAEKAGLSASLKLLRREAKRVDRPSIRRARAFTPGTRGGRAMTPDKTLSVARLAVRPAVAAIEARDGPGSVLKGRLQMLRNRLEDDLPGGSGVKQAFATLRRKARVGGRVKVRDHRGRDGGRRPKVRDHRDGDRVHRGRARRGKVRDHRSRPSKPAGVQISGTISATDGHDHLLDGITLGYVWDLDDGDETPIELDRRSSRRLTFTRRFKAARGRGTDYEFILRDADGEELDRSMIELGDDDDVSLDWTVSAESLSIELSGRFTPTLHGYGIEVVPPCPNPDESLNWP